MDKFIYAVCNSRQTSVNIILATSYQDAQNRIIQKYWDKYDDLEEDEWKTFLQELQKKHGIFISEKLLEADEI